jgi:hypothetical protein
VKIPAGSVRVRACQRYAGSFAARQSGGVLWRYGGSGSVGSRYGFVPAAAEKR